MKLRHSFFFDFGLKMKLLNFGLHKIIHEFSKSKYFKRNNDSVKLMKALTEEAENEYKGSRRADCDCSYCQGLVLLK